MGRVTRIDFTLGLSCLLALACGSDPMQMESAEIVGGSLPTATSPRTTTPASSAGAPATASGVMRASARIEPLMLATGTTTTAPTTPPATDPGTTAAAAGASASAGASAGTAGAGGSSTGTSAAGAGGSAGAAGSGTGAGVFYAAAGSGGDAAAAGSGSAAAGASAGAAGDTSTAAAGAPAPSGGASGMAAPATTGSGGAGGAEAPANIMGSASFASNSKGVNLSVMVSGCQSGKKYPIHIHQGGSCESAMTQGGHWDMTRGEGIPDVACGNRQGATTLSRPNTDAALAWTIGDGSATDLVGRTVVIHDADDPTQRIACGVITK